MASARRFWSDPTRFSRLTIRSMGFSAGGSRPIRFISVSITAFLRAAPSDEGVILSLHPSDWLIDASPPTHDEDVAYPGEQPPTDDELDYALLRLDTQIGLARGRPPESAACPAAGFPFPSTRELVPGMALAIVQYAEGGPLKVAFDTNAVIGLNKAKNRVQYTTVTAIGSGGAPCFDSKWQLVALHQGTDDRNPTGPQPRQGIPISAIRARIARVGKLAALGGEPPEVSS